MKLVIHVEKVGALSDLTMIHGEVEIVICMNRCCSFVSLRDFCNFFKESGLYEII